MTCLYKGFSLRLTALSLWLLLSGALCAGNWGAFESSAFIIQENDPGRMRGALLERMTGSYGRYLGLSRSFQVTRMRWIDIGAGLNIISIQKETQGAFPENNEYGFIYADSKSHFWSFPVSLNQSFKLKGYYRIRLRIAYELSVESLTKTSLVALGGAVQSAYYADYKNDIQRFHHAVKIAFANDLVISRGAIIEIAPWFGLGNAYYKGEGKGPGSMSFGVDLNFRFKLPKISIEWIKDPRNEEKKKQLEKKQKEIEEQLKNKPTPK